jgi:arylformamidase
MLGASVDCLKTYSPESGNVCRASRPSPSVTTLFAASGTNNEGSMPEKGPPVYLDYDQAALDAAYDQAAYAPNREQLIKRRISDSELVRLHVGEPERVAYGPAEIERLDIYRTRRTTAPAFVFVHGGAWRGGRSKDFAGAAEMFLAAGAHYVVPDFAWVQDVDGSLIVLADQVRRAVAWVYENAARIGIDPNQLYVGGQSSGGHLAAVVLTTDWRREFGLPANIIKGGMCISGMYDLTPVRLSARSNYVKFDDAAVAALSPIRHLDRLLAPLIVAYGTCETPEFQRQNREFVTAVKAAGKPVRLLVGEHYNHFELPETLANPYGLLGRAALDLMGLKAEVTR